MRLILNFHKPLTGVLQHSVYTLARKECRRFQRQYGSPMHIMRTYPESLPAPFQITGEGWVIEESGYVKESVFIKGDTLKIEEI